MCLLFIGVATPLLVRGTNASPCSDNEKVFTVIYVQALYFAPYFQFKSELTGFVFREQNYLIIKGDQNQNTSTKGLAFGHQNDLYLSLWFQGGKHQKFLCYNKYIELQTSFDGFIPFGFLFFRRFLKILWIPSDHFISY